VVALAATIATSAVAAGGAEIRIQRVTAGIPPPVRVRGESPVVTSLSARIHEHAPHADLSELRRRLSERMDDWKRARDRASLRRAARIEEMIGQVVLYRELLERLSAAPAFQAR
jgi:hypothetical protein